MKKAAYLSLISVAALLAFTACKTTPQMSNRPDFLSTYTHLEKVDATSWRYVSPILLRQCSKFIVSPVKVMINEHAGETITPEQRQRGSDFVRSIIVTAIADRYPVVTEAGPGVGEIRIAVTEAYRTGGKLGLCLQGEILDNSNTQVAAVVRTEISQYYTGDWQDKPMAREMVTAWGERLRKLLDGAQGK
jgi:hypothetical protein